MTEGQQSTVAIQQNAAQTPAKKADVNKIIDGVNNLINLASGVVNLKKAVIEAECEISKIDREIEKLSYELGNQQKGREYNLEQTRQLHDKMQQLISTATQISLRPNVAETELKIIQMYLSLANNCLNKLP